MISELFLSNIWVVKSTLLLLSICLLQFAFRKYMSASFRHLLWTLGFAGMLLIPVFGYIADNSDFVIQINYPSETIPLNKSFINGHEDQVISSEAIPIPDKEIINDSSVKALPSPISWNFYLHTLWLIGLVFFLVLLIIEKVFIQLLLRRSSDAPVSVVHTLQELQRLHSIPFNIRIAVSRHIDIPFTTGYIRPVIFLPIDFINNSLQKQSFVLLHELGHIQRRDGLSTLLTQINCAVFWFNPLAWLAAHWSKVDMEKACDDLVIQATRKKYDYASLLLDVIESSKFSPFYLQNKLAVVSKNELHSRMMAILDDKTNRNSIGKSVISTLSILTFCILVPFAAIQFTNDFTENKHVESDTSISQYLDDLSSENDEKVQYAAWALGTSENPEAVDELITQLRHPNPDVRAMIIWALGEIKVNQTLDDLLIALQDEEPLVREMAVKSIGELEDPRAIPHLASILNDPFIGVQTAVVWSLGEIQNQEALDLVNKSLHNSSPEVLKMAIKVLGEAHHQKAIPYLIQSLSDPRPGIRKSAVKALGQIGDKQAVAPLLPLLHDPSIEVREATVWALDELKI